MSVPQQATITDAEVLAVTDGVDDATGQSIVCLTLRLGSVWSLVNYSLSIENARSLLARLLSVWADELPASPTCPCSR
jgi:hypothetical protein